MKILVITGGIGSGKSAVSRILMKKGVPVYDCDSRVKGIYGTHPELRAMVTEDLFSNPQRLDDLEKALFPVLMSDFRNWAEAAGTEWVAMESATILDKEYFDDFPDKVIFVDAPVRTRLQRVLSRGGISEKSILERMALQSASPSDPRVDFVIENDSTFGDLELKVEEILNRIYYGKRKN